MNLVEFVKVRGYSLYVLICLLLAYLLNQLDRYTLAVVTKPMAQTIHYGDQVCMSNASFTADQLTGVNCSAKSQQSCIQETNSHGLHVCEWNYNGQGFEYQLVAGPIFIVIYTFAGIFLGFAADNYNRKNMLAVCCAIWSLMTLLTGAVNEYWQLVILRFGLGIAEAGCTPFAASLIADYFEESQRGFALGVYNWGIYVGYSMSYAVGNFITNADILNEGWRWAFYISGIPGILLGALILVTVKEPDRSEKGAAKSDEAAQPLLGLGQEERPSACDKLKTIFSHFCSPSLILIIIGGSIRNAAGYVWAYNTQAFYIAVGQTPQQIGTYMSWIPIIGGSLGVVLGGVIADRVVTRSGPPARLVVIVISLITAAPFAAGALLLPPPWGYISLLPANVIGEMWVGITIAVIIELVPASLRASAVAVYLFIITNVAGLVPLLVPVLQRAFEHIGLNAAKSLLWALFILYPGEYVIGAVFYFSGIFVLIYELRQRQKKEYTPID